MEKFYTDDQIDKFIKAYVEKYPDAIDRMKFIMLHPFRDNNDRISKISREINEIASSVDFLKIDSLDNDAIHLLKRDVAARVAQMLGPIGSYEIEE